MRKGVHDLNAFIARTHQCLSITYNLFVDDDVLVYQERYG